jgi:MFS transporter, SHS family, lactate transporter
MHVKESPAWKMEHRVRTLAGSPPHRVKFAHALEERLRAIRKHLPHFLFMVAMMFCFMSFSHGTQDLYPTYLKTNLHFSTGMVSAIAILYNLGALAGGMCFGGLSEKLGRRRAIAAAALISIPLVPLWAFSHSPVLVTVGAVLMQFMVQGAWGVVPAHLNELSPAGVRATLPGVAYQLGALLTAWNVEVQAKITNRWFGGNYSVVLAATVVIVAIALAVVVSLGREEHGADLSRVR